MCQFERGSISSMWCSEEEHRQYVRNAQIQAKFDKNELDTASNNTGCIVSRNQVKATQLPPIEINVEC